MNAVLDEFECVATRMDAGFKQLWLDGLEDGGYPQGRGQLRVTDPITGRTCYCAGGVLCDMSSIAWVPTDASEIIPEGSWAASAKDATLEVFEIPLAVLVETGLSPEMAGHISNANDEEISFVAIARFIRQHL